MCFHLPRHGLELIQRVAEALLHELLQALQRRRQARRRLLDQEVAEALEIPILPKARMLKQDTNVSASVTPRNWQDVQNFRPEFATRYAAEAEKCATGIWTFYSSFIALCMSACSRSAFISVFHWSLSRNIFPSIWLLYNHSPCHVQRQGCHVGVKAGAAGARKVTKYALKNGYDSVKKKRTSAQIIPDLLILCQCISCPALYSLPHPGLLWRWH